MNERDYIRSAPTPRNAKPWWYTPEVEAKGSTVSGGPSVGHIVDNIEKLTTKDVNSSKVTQVPTEEAQPMETGGRTDYSGIVEAIGNAAATAALSAAGVPGSSIGGYVGGNIAARLYNYARNWESDGKKKLQSTSDKASERAMTPEETRLVIEKYITTGLSEEEFDNMVQNQIFKSAIRDGVFAKDDRYDKEKIDEYVTSKPEVIDRALARISGLVAEQQIEADGRKRSAEEEIDVLRAGVVEEDEGEAWTEAVEDPLGEEVYAQLQAEENMKA
jgi:hypothetical protein